MCKRSRNESNEEHRRRAHSPSPHVPAREERLLLALAEASRSIQRARDASQVFQRVCDEIARLGFDASVFTLTEDERSLRIGYATFDSRLVKASERLMGLTANAYTFELTPGSFQEQVLREGEAVFSDSGSAPIADALPKELRPQAGRLARLLGVGPAIYAPLIVEGGRYGLMTVLGSDLRESDVPAISAFASQVAIAVENAIAYQEAERARERAQQYLDIAAVILVALDRSGMITMINRKGCEILGRTEDELVGQRWTEACLPERIREDVQKVFDRLVGGESGPLEYLENPVLTANGEERIIAWHNAVLRDEGGVIVGTLSSGEDITERTRAAEDLRSYRDQLENLIDQRTTELRTAVDAAGAAMFHHNIETGDVVLDDRWFEMAGVSRDHFPNTQSSWLSAVHPMDRERVTRRIKQVFASDATAMQIEYRLLRPDGGVRHIESRSIVLRDDAGRATETVGLNIDVTDRVETEEALREREALLRTTIDNVPADFWATDGELRFTIQNERCRRSLGDLIGRPITEMKIPPDLMSTWLKENRRVLAGETIQQEFELPIDGESRSYVARISPLVIDGEVRGTIGTSIDITERKSAEDALRKSEAYLRAVMENVPIDFFALDRNMRYTMQSAVSRSVVGDVIGKGVEDTDAPDELRQQWIEEHGQVLAGETIHREYRIPVGDEMRTFITTIAPVKIDSEVIGTIGTSMDITERERMESELRRARDALEERVQERTEELRESEERFRTLFVRAPDAFYITDLSGRFLDGNRVAEQLVGLSKDELVGRTLAEAGLLSPEDLPRAKALLSTSLRGRPTGPDEFVLHRPDGTEVPIEIRTYPLPLAGRAVIFAIARDITERRRMIEALRASKELAEQLIDTANAIIVELGTDGEIIRFNRHAERISGYKRAEVLGRSWFEVLIPEGERSGLSALFGEALDRSQDTFSNVTPIVCKGGERRIVEWRNTTISAEDGTVAGLLSIGIDVTERERALRDLRASETHLLEVLEGTIAAFARTVEVRDPYTAGHQENVAQLATRIARKLGLPSDRVEATRVAGLLHDIGKIAIPSEILTKPTRLSPAEWNMIRQHPANAYRILEGIRFPWPIAEIVRQHHERPDGTGYPDGLKDEEIFLEARILSVADTVEAMAAHRPYRAAVGLEAARDEIERGAGTTYDADVVEACIAVLEEDDSLFRV